jgi:hypothetical protein
MKVKIRDEEPKGRWRSRDKTKNQREDEEPKRG